MAGELLPTTEKPQNQFWVHPVMTGGSSGCNQANRENDGREEIVKRSGAEIVKRTWTEIRARQETVVICWTRRILTLCCWRMLTLPCSLTNTDHVLIAEIQKSKQSKNVNMGEKKYVLPEPDGDKRGRGLDAFAHMVVTGSMFQTGGSRS